jgi:hypothetical protein
MRQYDSMNTQNKTTVSNWRTDSFEFMFFVICHIIVTIFYGKVFVVVVLVTIYSRLRSWFYPRKDKEDKTMNVIFMESYEFRIMSTSKP